MLDVLRRKWFKADGTYISIRRMSSLHIRNCMYMITRSYYPEFTRDTEQIFQPSWTLKWGHVWLYLFARELRRRVKESDLE